MYGLWVVFLVIAGRAKVTTRNFPASLAGLAANVVLIVVLVPPLGIAGAGIALCGAYLVMLGVMHALTRRAFAVTFEWRRLAQLCRGDGRTRGRRRPAAANAWRGRPPDAGGGVRGDSARAAGKRVRAPRGAAWVAEVARPGTPARPPRRAADASRSQRCDAVCRRSGGRAEAVQALTRLETTTEDQLILADNSGAGLEVAGAALEVGAGQGLAGVSVVRAEGERSPAHARNVGAAHAGRDWILFLDCRLHRPTGPIDAYFAEPIGERVGALAGEVVPAGGARTLAARYGTARNFLDQQQHLAHPYRPRAVAANLLVRRAALEQVGGFYEGLRAAEDTDFSWRLQEAGWRLELRPQARVEHRYRADAVRATAPVALATPPGARGLRGATRASSPSRRSRVRCGAGAGVRGGRCPAGPRPGTEDAWNAAASWRSTRCWRPRSWRDSRSQTGRREVTRSFRERASSWSPSISPHQAIRWSISRARSTARGWRPARAPKRSPPNIRLRIDYREDDGALLRASALIALAARHPVRSLLDLLGRSPSAPPLRALAPAVRRLERDPSARVHALGRDQAQAVAQRLAALAGRSLEGR